MSKINAFDLLMKGTRKSPIRGNFPTHKLMLGLQEAVDKGIRELYVEGDSMLVIKQVRNEWAVKSPNLIPLYKEVKELCNSFSNIKFEHVKRGNNKTADALVNSALDEIDS